jgi:predicted RNA methylase
LKRKVPCKKDTAFEELIEKKVKEVLSKTNNETIKIENASTISSTNMIPSAESVREAGLDKFYTIPEISKKCLESIESRYKWNDWGLVIEPSAGNGSFLTRIPTEKKLGIDISPEHKDIIKQELS